METNSAKNADPNNEVDKTVDNLGLKCRHLFAIVAHEP
jgi:hypothetical protein